MARDLASEFGIVFGVDLKVDSGWLVVEGWGVEGEGVEVVSFEGEFAAGMVALRERCVVICEYLVDGSRR